MAKDNISALEARLIAARISYKTDKAFGQLQSIYRYRQIYRIPTSIKAVDCYEYFNDKKQLDSLLSSFRKEEAASKQKRRLAQYKREQRKNQVAYAVKQYNKWMANYEKNKERWLALGIELEINVKSMPEE